MRTPSGTKLRLSGVIVTSVTKDVVSDSLSRVSVVLPTTMNMQQTTREKTSTGNWNYHQDNAAIFVSPNFNKKQDKNRFLKTEGWIHFSIFRTPEHFILLPTVVKCFTLRRISYNNITLIMHHLFKTCFIPVIILTPSKRPHHTPTYHLITLNWGFFRRFQQTAIRLAIWVIMLMLSPSALAFSNQISSKYLQLTHLIAAFSSRIPGVNSLLS